MISNSLQDLYSFIELLDLSLCNVNTAEKYRYVKPVLLDNGKSHVKVTGLRHPLAERIIDTKYVSHDVNLNCDGICGVLLYGINASGKSMLLKSIGISVVMAQAGLYVPCDTMELSVYTCIVSQVDLVDNFYKNASSFTSEVQGIKNILTLANVGTLVLADELCKGTESTSGASILGSLIYTLIERDVSFVFTSHLHELTKVKFISDLEKLRICHLSIEKGESGVVFNRNLIEGPSDTLYGIKVAEYMNLSKPFISICNEICDVLVNKTDSTVELTPKKSRYNTRKKVLKCEICSHKPKKQEIPLDTHHINFQCTAVNGFIGNYNKNIKGNLVVLCKVCHTSVHSGDITINGYIQTSRGTELDFRKNTDLIELN